MFDRKSYKRQAASLLKGRLKTPVIASVLVLLIEFIMAASDIPAENHPAGTFVGLAALFISGTVLIAYIRLFIQLYNVQKPAGLSDFINNFSCFLTGVLGLLWYSLWVALWSFLFIIPGIVKAFSYSQMFFVLAENPKIGISKAMNISKILTRHHKCDLFFMLVSFIGWELLSLLTLCILQIWLKPYELMSFTCAYYDLKQEAFRTGELTPADFTA